MSANQDSGKSYHLQCTGDALETANAHSQPADITLFGSCFCPFVQRAWVALEYLGIEYYVSLFRTLDIAWVNVNHPVSSVIVLCVPIN